MCFNCGQPTCDECNEIPCQSCPPVENLTCPADVPCETPDYTSDGCYPLQSSNCVIFDGVDDLCIPATKGTRLTTILSNLFTYSRNTLNRLVPDDSIDITVLDDLCDDKRNIKVNISAEENNALILKDDGLFVSTASGGGVDPIPQPICTGYESSLSQANSIPQSYYKFASFLEEDGEECEGSLISAPTGFAVSGANRVSAFGSMEWYETLIAANASAQEGETVLIYKDTPEPITLKNNVNYQGIGYHTVGLITITLAATSTGTNKLTNLKLVDGISCANDSANKIFANNVDIAGSFLLDGSLEWYGGNFLEDNNTLICLKQSKLTSFTSKRRVKGIENSEITFGKISYSGDGGIGLQIYNSSPGFHAKASHITVSCTGLNTFGSSFESVGNAGGAITASNILSSSISGKGVYAHNGGGDILPDPNTVNSRSLNLSFISGNSVTAEGFNVVSSFGLSASYSSRKPNIVSCNAFSVDGKAWVLTNGNIKNCTGYSINNNACYINGTQDGFGHNCNITDCIMESNNSYALNANGDFYIVGGTYITNSINVGPVLIGQGNPTHGSYFIDSIKTIQRSTTAYSIDSSGPITARISRSSFLCQDLLTNVPGINEGISFITLRAVNIDAYGNIR